MGLDRVTATNRNLSGQGWKVFSQIGDEIHSSIVRTKKAYPLACWIKDNSIFYFNAFPPYPAGISIFKKKKDANDYLKWLSWYISDPLVVKKVKYRGAHTYGEIGGAKVVIAREMYIEP